MNARDMTRFGSANRNRVPGPGNDSQGTNSKRIPVLVP